MSNVEKSDSFHDIEALVKDINDPHAQFVSIDTEFTYGGDGFYPCFPGFCTDTKRLFEESIVKDDSAITQIGFTVYKAWNDASSLHEQFKTYCFYIAPPPGSTFVSSFATLKWLSNNSFDLNTWISQALHSGYDFVPKKVHELVFTKNSFLDNLLNYNPSISTVDNLARDFPLVDLLNDSNFTCIKNENHWISVYNGSIDILRNIFANNSILKTSTTFAIWDMPITQAYIFSLLPNTLLYNIIATNSYVRKERIFSYISKLKKYEIQQTDIDILNKIADDIRKAYSMIRPEDQLFSHNGPNNDIMNTIPINIPRNDVTGKNSPIINKLDIVDCLLVDFNITEDPYNLNDDVFSIKSLIELAKIVQPLTVRLIDNENIYIAHNFAFSCEIEPESINNVINCLQDSIWDKFTVKVHIKVHKSINDAYISQLKSWKSCQTAIIGLKQVFSAIVQNNKPLITFNGIDDLQLMCRHFTPLADKYAIELFNKRFNLNIENNTNTITNDFDMPQCFSYFTLNYLSNYIYDIKQITNGLIRSVYGSLVSHFSYFQSLLKEHIVSLYNGNENIVSSFNDSRLNEQNDNFISNAHNAGCDAFMTGYVFSRILVNCLHNSTLEFLSYTNKLFIHLADACFILNYPGYSDNRPIMKFSVPSPNTLNLKQFSYKIPIIFFESDMFPSKYYFVPFQPDYIMKKFNMSYAHYKSSIQKTIEDLLLSNFGIPINIFMYPKFYQQSTSEFCIPFIQSENSTQEEKEKIISIIQEIARMTLNLYSIQFGHNSKSSGLIIQNIQNKNCNQLMKDPFYFFILEISKFGAILCTDDILTLINGQYFLN